MPGPPPKHPSARVRRNDTKKDFRVLPLEGRQGETPDWPLLDDVESLSRLEVQRDRIANLQVELDGEEDGRKRGRLQRELNKLELANAALALQIEQAADAEKARWAEVWTYPQAVMWEENRSHLAVASWVRWKIREEQGDLKAGDYALKLADRLGLTDLSLQRLRAETERAALVEDEGQRRRAKKAPAEAEVDSVSSDDDEPDDPRLALVQ